MGSQWSLWSRASSYIPVFNMLWAILCWASLSHWIAMVLEAETWCSFFRTLKKLKSMNCTCLPVFRAAKASLRGFYFSLRSLPNPAFLLGHVLQKWLWSHGTCSCKILQWEPFNLRFELLCFFFFFQLFYFGLSLRAGTICRARQVETERSLPQGIVYNICSQLTTFLFFPPSL